MTQLDLINFTTWCRLDQFTFQVPTNERGWSLFFSVSRGEHWAGSLLYQNEQKQEADQMRNFGCFFYKWQNVPKASIYSNIKYSKHDEFVWFQFLFFSCISLAAVSRTQSASDMFNVGFVGRMPVETWLPLSVSLALALSLHPNNMIWFSPLICTDPSVHQLHQDGRVTRVRPDGAPLHLCELHPRPLGLHHFFPWHDALLRLLL